MAPVSVSGQSDSTGAMMREDVVPLRRGAALGGQVVALIGLLALFAVLVSEVWHEEGILSASAPLFVGFSLIAAWRWGWAALHFARAVIYRWIVYPRLRKRASSAVAQFGPVPEVYVLATTYKEYAWITHAVFQSIFRELSELPGLARPAEVIFVTGCDADDENLKQAYEDAIQEMGERRDWAPRLILLRGADGKRLAIGNGLRYLRDRGVSKESVVVLMDGDTMVEPKLFARVLPMFRLQPAIAAVTTNEDTLVDGPAWFAEWLSLRFGQRHLQMCSLALSHSLLCLTGRLSAIRGDIATDPSFGQIIEDDRINHWLFGMFRMLSGDDKSTWYWMARRGARMLYVPDAKATTFEVIKGNAYRRATANMSRWSGNMLRNSWRSIYLGPSRLGLFPWWCVIDQRMAMWTVLIGPVTALLSAMVGRWDLVAAYALWVLCSRMVRVVPAMVHGRRFSACYVPIQVCSEWAGALVKLWVAFHPAKQTWFNRDRRTLDSSRGHAFFLLRRSIATYLYLFWMATFVFTVGVCIGVIPFFAELRLMNSPATAQPVQGGIRSGAATRVTTELDTSRPRASDKGHDFTNVSPPAEDGPRLDAWQRLADGASRRGV